MQLDDWTAANSLIQRVSAGRGAFEHPSPRLLADAAWLARARARARAPRTPLQLTVHTLTGRQLQIQAHGSWSSLRVLRWIQSDQGIPVEQQRLIIGTPPGAPPPGAPPPGAPPPGAQRRQLRPHDAQDLRAQGLTDGDALTLVLHLRGGCYSRDFPYTMSVTPAMNNANVSCSRREIVIEADVRASIDFARSGEHYLSSHPPFPGLTGPYGLETRVLEHLDALSLMRIGLTCVRRTLTRREGTEVQRWGYHELMATVLVLRRFDIPADLCRRIFDAVSLPPEQWEAGEEVQLRHRIELAALERGLLRLRACSLAGEDGPLLQPHRHYRLDLFADGQMDAGERFMDTYQHFPQRDPEVPSERDFARRLRRIRSRSWHFQTGPPTGGSDQELQTRDFRDGSSTIELACEIGF